MQYTCGYFADANESIDQAQERKLDYVCRKLCLKPGERLIDFGCGWGGLITFAAKNYGVKAVGVSISKEQIRWTNREIEKMGVGDRCRIEYLDYRKVPEAEPFDKAVSVGFMEHLGEKMMPTFFSKVWRLLRHQGLYLHHAITYRPNTPFPPWRAFALKYVFPDGELVPITKTLHHLAGAGFEIRDVESLREHYVYTLRRWLERLEENHAEAARLTDEVNYRIFRIYFAGAIQGFLSERLQSEPNIGGQIGRGRHRLAVDTRGLVCVIVGITLRVMKIPHAEREAYSGSLMPRLSMRRSNRARQIVSNSAARLLLFFAWRNAFTIKRRSTCSRTASRDNGFCTGIGP